MGNYRFRFSDMIPNAWFYKLKDMSRNRNHHNKILNPTKKKHSSSSSPSSSASSSTSSSSSTVAASTQNHASEVTEKQSHLSEQRKSYYFTRELNIQHNSPIKTRIPDKQLPVEPQRKSSRRRRNTKRSGRPPHHVSSSTSAGTKPQASSPSSSEHDSVLTEYGSDRLSWSSSCKCRTESDIIIDMDDDDNNDKKPFKEMDHLHPIITKKHEPTKIRRTSAEFSETNKYGSLSVKVVKENFVTTTSPVRRFSVNSSSPGVKLRTNSPKIANRRIKGRRSVSSNSSSGGSRRSMSESFAVVKSSKDPRRDFRESMMEMIVENNIRASKDMEELLACYLSLNSNEYHDLIINVFKQIWFDFIHHRLK